MGRCGSRHQSISAVPNQAPRGSSQTHLGEHVHLGDAAVDAVAHGHVDQPVRTTDWARAATRGGSALTLFFEQPSEATVQDPGKKPPTAAQHHSARPPLRPTPRCSRGGGGVGGGGGPAHCFDKDEEGERTRHGGLGAHLGEREQPSAWCRVRARKRAWRRGDAMWLSVASRRNSRASPHTTLRPWRRRPTRLRQPRQCCAAGDGTASGGGGLGVAVLKRRQPSEKPTAWAHQRRRPG